MVAIVYARVSSEDQARLGFSLASQVEAGRARAEALGAREVAVFTDEGAPGDVLERPGLQGALEAVRRGGVALFVCYDPDRLARSLSLQLLVTDQVERAGTRLEFVNFEYRNTPEGQLFYSLRGAIAQFEKAKIRERTMRGKRQKARSGGLTHNPCIYGYDFDPATDTLTVNAAEARVVQAVFRWFLEEDLGPWAIARRLTAMGIPPARGGPAWHHSSVRNILRNGSYTGTLYQQKWDYTDTRNNKYRPRGEKVKRRIKPESEWIPVPIPAIVDADTYRAALARLADVRRRWAGRRREEYLLSGLCYCALCRRPVYGASRQSGRERLRYYVCRGYAPGAPGAARCPLGRLRADAIEEEVWQEVRRWLLARAPGLHPPAPPAAGPLHAELDLLRQQLAEVQAEHGRTARLVARGTVSPEVGEALLRDQRGRIAYLQERIGQVQGELAAQAATDPGPGALAAGTAALHPPLAALVDRWPLAQRQQVVRALVKAVELSRTETVILARLATVPPGPAPGG